jgi:hypothetical protein
MTEPTRPSEPAAQTDPPLADIEARDPNVPAFWDERFARGVTPWDQAGVPPAFEAFAARQAVTPVLIPGCGNAWEARWLAEHGWPVRAIDFAAKAVEAARLQLGAHAAVVEQADFFSWQPDVAPRWVYERAFLCALPPSRRMDYAQRMAELLLEGGLLAGFFFIGATPKGPPFGIEKDELNALLSPHFDLIEDEPVADSLAVFEGRERWLTWRRRAAGKT